MLNLSGRAIECVDVPPQWGRQVIRLSTNPHRPQPLRVSEAYLSRDGSAPPGFRCYVFTSAASAVAKIADAPRITLPESFAYLEDGDVLRIDPARGAVRALFRRNSKHNSFLVTERCNHLCLMCSQPPRDVDDSHIIDDILATIPLIDRDTQEIGFTGGEPTLLGDRFLQVLRACKSFLPQTAVHILSNGRRFADESFVIAYASIAHPDMVAGIPIYSDISDIHDHVVQSDGAFDETIRGILNLKRFRQRVEVRVVIHRLTYERLPQLAEFIARNLTFVDHVALMGLEITGFTRANLNQLWIDPFDYRDELYRATTVLAGHRMNVSIYNHQLCVLDPRVWPFARKSISDWKNEYFNACAPCKEKESCGGFFSSAKLKYSEHIRPFV